MNFFDFVDAFLNSDFAKQNVPQLIFVGVLLIVLGGLLTWLFFRFIHYRNVLNKAQERKKEVKALKKENQSLKQSNTSLARLLKQNDIVLDGALRQFTDE